MHRIDGEGATSDNKFTEGNPSTGTLATEVTADWGNDLQENVCRVIEEAGITLVKGDWDQLLQAIQALIAGGGSAITAAGVNIADAGEFFSGGEVEAALQQLATKLYNGTLGANQIRRTVFSLNVTQLLINLTHAESIVEISNGGTTLVTIRPDSTIDFPVGTAITFVQSGVGKLNFQAEPGVTLKKPASFNAISLEQEATVVLYKVAANSWRLGGMLEAA